MYRNLLGMLLTVTLSQPTAAIAEDLPALTFGRYVGRDGEIRLPPDVRAQWTHLGSWLVADVNAPGHGFHDVYAQPQAVRHYRRTGRFPDGTVLVKEIRAVESGEMTTGRAVWAGPAKVWFVMVKDDRRRFTGNRHWAEGWGWALFNAEQPRINVSKGFKESCSACHMPAKSSDWLFVTGYPSLDADRKRENNHDE